MVGGYGEVGSVFDFGCFVRVMRVVRGDEDKERTHRRMTAECQLMLVVMEALAQDGMFAFTGLLLGC